jgi:hypothetical protein
MQDLYEQTVDRLRRVNETVKILQISFGRHVGLGYADVELGEEERMRPHLPAVLTGHLATDACPGCAFLHYCSTELSMPVDQVAILDDPDLEGFLELRDEHRANHLKYDEAHADAKGLLDRLKITLGPKGKAYFIVGSFLITASQVRPKGKAPYFAYDIWRRPDPPQGG